MIKRTIHAAVFVTVAIGAAHSYDQVRFGERAAVFFKTALAEEDAGHASRGRRDFDRGRREDRGRIQRTARREAGDEPESVRRPPGDTAQVQEVRRRRSREFRGRGGHGHRGALISLEEVAYYAIIFAFATMLTYTIDGFVKRAGRVRMTSHNFGH